jgi:hypothetical protein
MIEVMYHLTVAKKNYEPKISQRLTFYRDDVVVIDTNPLHSRSDGIVDYYRSFEHVSKKVA